MVVDLQEAKRRLSEEFSGRSHVVGVGLPYGQLGIYLDGPRKLEWGLPDEYLGHPVTYIETGRHKALDESR